MHTPSQVSPFAVSPKNQSTSSLTSGFASNTANRYLSRDVASDPPTAVWIVADAAQLPPLEVANGGGVDIGSSPSPLTNSLLYLLESDVEPTNGWHSRFQKPQLSLCFMHSFGKCNGRSHGDPSTCHQIHVRREALERLRAKYIFPQRRFFSRTVKAGLSQELLQAISRVAKKDLTIQYLEYLAHDVAETEGLHAYERSYRSWLSAPGGFQNTFHEISISQCLDFCLKGYCEMGRECPAVHAHLRRAQVRDALVLHALNTISSQLDCSASMATLSLSGTTSPPCHEVSASLSAGTLGSRALSPALSPRFASRPVSGCTSPVQNFVSAIASLSPPPQNGMVIPRQGTQDAASHFIFSGRVSPPVQLSPTHELAFQTPASTMNSSGGNTFMHPLSQQPLQNCSQQPVYVVLFPTDVTTNPGSISPPQAPATNAVYMQAPPQQQQQPQPATYMSLAGATQISDMFTVQVDHTQQLTFQTPFSPHAFTNASGPNPDRTTPTQPSAIFGWSSTPQTQTQQNPSSTMFLPSVYRVNEHGSVVLASSQPSMTFPVSGLP